uniref:Ig-like domain-containing protein n=1 Tax=Poecilia formosa TaxID=48698 RepID=A0A096M6D4_POEFO
MDLSSPVFVPVRLIVSPSRSQLFKLESVTLTCEDENSSDGWTVRRNTTRGTRKGCEGWGKLNGSTCSISYIFNTTSGKNTCSSLWICKQTVSTLLTKNMAGLTKSINIRKISIRASFLITLKCFRSLLTQLVCCWIILLPAEFIKVGVFLNMAATKVKTGHLFSCSQPAFLSDQIKVTRAKVNTRITFKYKPTVAPPTSKAPPPASNPFQLLLTVMRHLLVLCPYIISTLLFVSLYQHR